MSDKESPDIKLGRASIDDLAADKKILEETSRYNKTSSGRIHKTDIDDDVNTQSVLKQKEELLSGEGVLDPLALRDSDTSKLKRIKPKSATQTIDLDSENISDTVHLKVIKEKKKQLAGILTASQTIRLRPPSGPTGAPAPLSQPQVQSSQTLKITPGATNSAGSVNMPPQVSPAGTLKINMPASSTESGTIKVVKPNFAEVSSAGTLKIKSPMPVENSGATAGGTLKIKSATATASASGTLKLKSAAGSEETVKIVDSGAEKKGGTLKLKASGTTESAPQGVKRHSARADEETVTAVNVELEDPKAKPGIFMTLSSVVAISAIGIIVFKLIENYMQLFTHTSFK